MVVGLLERERRAIPSCLVWASAHPRTTGRGSCEPVPRPSSSVGRSPEASLRVARWPRVSSGSPQPSIKDSVASSGMSRTGPARGLCGRAGFQRKEGVHTPPWRMIQIPGSCGAESSVDLCTCYRWPGVRSRLARCTYVYGSPSMTSAESPVLLTLITLTARDHSEVHTTA